MPNLARVNPSTALSHVLVDELVRCGVTDVVLAPGSRSAPLAFALHAADSEAALRLHVRIDERSAGFLALGLARARGVAAVVTTSGTAVANLHPAVLEADHAGVPLLVVSADRPGELRGVGANQTIDQIGIFGRSTRLFHDIPAPDDRPGQVAYWRSTVSRSVLTARGELSGHPGPVHLNVALREPLVPDGGDGGGRRTFARAWVEPLDGRAGGRPWTDAEAGQAPGSTGSGDLDWPARTLVVVGDAPATVQRAAVSAARRAGWPVVAEPIARGGAAETVECGPLIVGVDPWLAENRPDRIVLVGRATLSRPIARLLAGSVALVEVVAPSPSWADPGHAASRIHPTGALATVGAGTGDPAFVAAWRKAGERARAAVEEVLDDAPASGLSAARAVVDAIPADGLLYLGSSSVIRDIDMVGGRLPAIVHANRGVAGIDGTVSSAVGAALGTPSVPAYAVIGDLTFLHDANGLIIGPDEPRSDLCVVVFNDDGGGIFGLLEQGASEHADAFERIFGTPHGSDLAALCAAHRVPYEQVGLDGVASALTPRAGLRVVEVPIARDHHRDLHARLRSAVAAALSPTPPASRPDPR